MVEMIIGLVSGAVGGNVAGALMKNMSLGTLWNSVVGILGGGLGSGVLGMVGLEAGGAGLDIGSIVGSVASGGVGGGILLAIVGFVKQAMAKS